MMRGSSVASTTEACGLLSATRAVVVLGTGVEPPMVVVSYAPQQLLRNLHAVAQIRNVTLEEDPAYVPAVRGLYADRADICGDRADLVQVRYRQVLLVNPGARRGDLAYQRAVLGGHGLAQHD